MNVSKFLVLGALDSLGTGSGYDVQRELEQRRVTNWTGIKTGSIYFAIRQLEKDACIEVVAKKQSGAFPVKSIYRTTETGRKIFDEMQEEAFRGLYPQYYGFKLALKFNRRRTADEIIAFTGIAIENIGKTLRAMDEYLETADPETLDDDRFFIRHDKLLLEAEKQWIKEVQPFIRQPACTNS